MSVKRNDQDYELLSAYIDGALSDAERAALESRLESDSQLRQELASLRQTVDLIRQLPDLKAPRDLTLDTARVRPRRTLPFPLTQTFSALSSAAAILLVIFGAHLLLQSDAAALNSNVAVQQAQAPAVQSRATAVASASELLPTATLAPTQTFAPLLGATLATLPEEGLDQAGNALELQQAAPADDGTTERDEETAAASASVGEAQTDNFTATLKPAGTLSNAAQAQPEQPQAYSDQIPTPTVEAAQEAGGAARQISPTQTQPLPTATALPTEARTTDQLAAQPPPAPVQPTSSFRNISNSPVIGVALLALGILLLIAAIITTLLRRRRA